MFLSLDCLITKVQSMLFVSNPSMFFMRFDPIIFFFVFLCIFFPFDFINDNMALRFC